MNASAERRSESVRQEECCTAPNVYFVLILSVLFLSIFALCCIPLLVSGVLVNGVLPPSSDSLKRREKLDELRSRYLRWRAEGSNSDEDGVNMVAVNKHKALFIRPPDSINFDFGRGKHLFGQFNRRFYSIFRFINTPIVIYFTNLVCFC